MLRQDVAKQATVSSDNPKDPVGQNPIAYSSHSLVPLLISGWRANGHINSFSFYSRTDKHVWRLWESAFPHPVCSVSKAATKYTLAISGSLRRTETTALIGLPKQWVAEKKHRAYNPQIGSTVLEKSVKNWRSTSANEKRRPRSSLINALSESSRRFFGSLIKTVLGREWPSLMDDRPEASRMFLGSSGKIWSVERTAWRDKILVGVLPSRTEDDDTRGIGAKEQGQRYERWWLGTKGHERSSQAACLRHSTHRPRRPSQRRQECHRRQEHR